MNPPDSTAPHRSTKVRLLLAGIFVAALVAVVLLLITPRGDTVTWLTPGTPLQQPLLPPGPLTTLKVRLQTLAAPLWQRILAARTQVSIDSHVFAVPDGTHYFSEIKSTAANQRDGVRAWILPDDEWKSLVQKLKAAPNVESLGNLKMLTLERMQSQIAVTGRALSSGQPIAVGTELHFFTRAGKRDVRLTLNAEVTEQLHQFTANARTVPVTNAMIFTNLSTALQVTVPDGGALVLAREATNAIAGRVLWLIISPSQVNPQGKPRKP